MIYWSANRAQREKTRLYDFLKAAEARAGRSFADYESLWAWSVENTSSFWDLWRERSGLIAQGSPVPVQEAGTHFRTTRWFPNLELNYAENMMAHLAEVPLVGTDESGARWSMTAAELRERVRAFQLELKRVGVGAGDVVAALVPHTPETVAAMLAVTSLGAAWSSCSPDFGVQGILDRFTQVNPKVLFTAEYCRYGGKRIDLEAKNAEVLAGLPKGTRELSVAHPPASDGAAPEFHRVPFSAPLFVMFSSGTTGKPKGIIHGVGGTLLQHAKEHVLHGDLRPGEKILYYTTCGWMMWNWVVSAIGVGATLVCYDGSPGYPTPDAIWGVVAKEGIENFGTSAKYIASNRVANVDVARTHNFTKLKRVFSTGSPLLPEDFDYFYTSVDPERRRALVSISGGTDILSCFMLGAGLKPVVRGEIQARGLGLDVRAFNAEGQPVVDEQGELVCAKPFPSMPVAFVDDADGEKYRKAYFDRFPGVWHHGDYVTVTKDGGVIVHGRSDATLNPGGVRIGTAEIYRQVETHPAIQDSIVVGQKWQDDERVILFVKMKSGTLTAAIVDELKSKIRAGASPRHVPAKIIEVSDIPYTASGKKVELAVKAVVHGQTPTNLGALANPAALDQFKNRPEMLS